MQHSTLTAIAPSAAAGEDSEHVRIAQLLLKRVDVRGDALAVRIRAEGLASLLAELQQHDGREAA